MKLIPEHMTLEWMFDLIPSSMTYNEYRKEVYERWQAGELNELTEEGLIKEESRSKNKITNRLLTHKEFNDLKEYLNQRRE